MRSYIGEKMEKRQKRIIEYLMKKYHKGFLTKEEAKVELLYEAKRMSIVECARLIVEEYRLGMFL